MTNHLAPNPLLKPPAGKNINRRPAFANKGGLFADPHAIGRAMLGEALKTDPHHPRHFDCAASAQYRLRRRAVSIQGAD